MTVKQPAATKRSTAATDEPICIHIDPIKIGTVDVCVLGTTPLICNRMSEKALHALLAPGPKMNRADKNTNQKHDPLEEYRLSPYTNLVEGPTRLQLLASMFKGATAMAALDTPGVAKTQVGRMVWVEGDRIDLYGIPEIMMAVVRSADLKRTPDIRTRAILRRWACMFRMSFRLPTFHDGSVLNLLAAGGLTSGIGDWRPGKGAGNYGQFQLVSPTDPCFLAVLEEGGREAQDEALADPEPYDDETRDMLKWFGEEMKRRSRVVEGRALSAA